MKKIGKKFDIAILLAFPLIAVGLSLAFKLNFFISTLLFYGLPAGYLTLRNKHAFGRTLIFTIPATLVAGLVFDYIAHFNGAWFVPTIFPWRVLGVVPIEDFVWGFLYVYSILMFYEHFLDKGRHNLADKKMKYFIILLLLMVSLFLLAYFNQPGLLLNSYVYAKYGIVLSLIPVVLFLACFPKFIAKYAKIVLYFSIVSFLNELTALKLGHWTFPGRDFIGWVELFGQRFPFEEFFFYVLLGAVMILSYFEYFDDNKLKKEARRYT